MGTDCKVTLEMSGDGHLLSDAFVAKMCHEANRALCQAHGDMSQPIWEEAPEWQRDSAIEGVKFHRANPTAGPEASHVNWCKHKYAEGWTFGHVKSPEHKTHFCLRPFHELPVEQQAKDFVFRAIIHAAK